MLDITILAIGKIKESYWKEASDEYLKRLKPYAKVKVEELRSESFTKWDSELAKIEESKRLENYLNRRPEAAVFLLAEKGEELDSIAFAKKLEKLNCPIILVVGGSLGFNSVFFAKHKKLSLSKLTFPHELARVVLLEQLFRTITIINKKDYHY